jgi:hypothetical protein
MGDEPLDGRCGHGKPLRTEAITQEVEALSIRPMKVLSGCFSRRRQPSTAFTRFTAFLSRQRVGASTRMSPTRR